MSVDQLPAQVREFVNYLDGLLARLDQGGGWCGVFWQRDPEGMRACLSGSEVPPWDVLESLLHDLAAQYGPGGPAPETERARVLHTAALAAYDARPGGHDALGDRLDVMLREQRYAAERQAELSRLLASAATREQADAIRIDLAWARDDHERATARCGELRGRMGDLERRGGGDGSGAGWFGGGGLQGDGFVEGWARGDGVTGGLGSDQVRAAGSYVVEGVVGVPGDRTEALGPDQVRPAGPYVAEGVAGVPGRPDAQDPPAPKQRKRRRGGARFAGMVEEETVAPVVVPPTAEPVLPTLPAQPAATTGRTPRGARFAGAAAEEVAVTPVEPQTQALDPADRREVGGIVEALVRLRGEGRSGEAHVLLVEAAHWPAVRLPLLAAEMQQAGLGADWATLLWEAASLPAERLVAAADALTAAGRAEDGEQILRQGVLRPAPEIGRAVLGLAGEGRRREVRALLDAYVRVRTPEEAARSVETNPRTLVPLLLEAAQGVSDERQWDLVHALRVAGFTA
ncbi:hypothetical protein [Streptomyces lanatus]|uniref:UL36 very large tegument protein n=1 Tax=Streptomyces lanatus TaxID=66900 RepID=A0ABV1XPW7_9ACTN|nr:hypothetical protein [Streptomyces lanatus]GHG87910.1 hypothetical protein GCM10018780_05890 [Streptomyces lanatus]